MTIDAFRLRALAEAATPGPWERHNGVDVFTKMGAPNRGGIVAEPFDGWQVADCGGVRLVQDAEGEEHEMPHSEAQANAAYIAAASPDAILALLDERDAMQRERDSAVREKVLATQTAQRLMAERDALAADARRYRWLRASSEGVEFRDGRGRWRADCPAGGDLDAVIDAALGGAKGAT